MAAGQRVRARPGRRTATAGRARYRCRRRSPRSPATATNASSRGSSSSPARSATPSQIADTGAADGTCHTGQRQIRIAERLAPNGRLVALIHELAHALVAVDDQAPELDYAEGELIAESVAWTCCQTVGLDSSANSIPYLASWAEQASLDVLERAAALTGRLADRIEQALLEDDPGRGFRDWLS